MYTLKQAKANLSRLIRDACDGKTVVIAGPYKVNVKLVPVRSAVRKRIPGQLKGKIWYAPDAFDPLTQKELRDLGFE
jgi:antitoxin (DNA-binding transcriptional repressor) of toxin-antitoxin stability system